MAPILQLSALALALCALCYLTIRSQSDTKDTLDRAIARHVELALRHLIPGEAMEAIRKAQTQLACYVQHGTWTTQDRSRIQYHHDLSCLENWSSLEGLSLPQITSLLCSHIFGKRVQLVGPRTFYYAQTLILQALALHDNKSYPSRGPESGTHYFVCGGSWNKEEPPLIPPSNPRNTSFSSRILSVDSTRLSFSLSDRLTFPQRSQHRMASQPVVDPQTGIRSYMSDWFSKTQKAQVLIMNKGPIPAPASTFGSPTGNWSFTKKMPQEVRARFQDSDLTFWVINAALHAVFREYLPDLVQALDALALSRKPQRIFLGSWYQQPVCTNAGLGPETRTTSLIWERNTNARIRRVDPWTLYYNTQVYIIGQVLPEILPYFNFTYIPMNLPLIPEFRGLQAQGQGLRKDCLRMPYDHPVGHSLQLTLMKALLYHFQNQ